LQRHLALCLLATIHHIKGFFVGLVDPDPGFAKMAPLKKKKSEEIYCFKVLDGASSVAVTSFTKA
jgi:hypothetical protein